MIPWFRRLFTDETAFIRAVRMLLLGLGTAWAGGYLPIPPKFQWVGIVIAGAGGFLPAGEKNPKARLVSAVVETRAVVATPEEPPK